MTLHSGRDMPPQKLYETYKERQIIGDSNKAYKHMPDHTASWMQDDKAFDEWLFLSHISWMLYCRLFNPIKRKGPISGYSAEDIIAMMKRVKTQSANGERNHPAGTKAGHDQLRLHTRMRHTRFRNRAGIKLHDT